MKILMYADGFGGNTTTFINNEVEYISQRHDLIFACINKLESGIFNFDYIHKLHIKTSIFQKILRRLDLSLDYTCDIFSQELNTLVRNFRPDVIHCHFGKEALKIIDNIEDKNIPIVIHFHGYDASSALKSKAYIKRLKKVLNMDNIYPIFVANYLRQNLLNLGIPIKNETILHCGIDLSKFKVQTSEQNHSNVKTFLQVSSLVEKKGHEYTLKAFAKFLQNNDDMNYKLILTGDGSRKNILMNLTKDLGIEKCVEFVGYVTPSEAVVLMQNADVFVHHSITATSGDQEGIPTALMEAMAMQLPVISTKHSGIPELIVDGENGYLVEEKDIEDYATKMSLALNMKRMEKNRDVIEKDFELIKHNESLLQLYSRIIEKSK